VKSDELFFVNDTADWLIVVALLCLSAARSLIFFVEGESECTSEPLSGQFNIFGAIEEMSSGIARAQKQE
jgi:hypothetical protein